MHDSWGGVGRFDGLRRSSPDEFSDRWGENSQQAQRRPIRYHANRAPISGGATAVYIALLRGINVGGHHKVAMKELAQAFRNAGCRDVRTYIQSGEE